MRPKEAGGHTRVQGRLKRFAREGRGGGGGGGGNVLSLEWTSAPFPPPLPLAHPPGQLADAGVWSPRRPRPRTARACAAQRHGPRACTATRRTLDRRARARAWTWVGDAGGISYRSWRPAHAVKLPALDQARATHLHLPHSKLKLVPKAYLPHPHSHATLCCLFGRSGIPSQPASVVGRGAGAAGELLRPGEGGLT